MVNTEYFSDFQYVISIRVSVVIIGTKMNGVGVFSNFAFRSDFENYDFTITPEIRSLARFELGLFDTARKYSRRKRE